MLAENLDVFKISHELVIDIYKVTDEFPYSENRNLTTQMQRAAISIPANLLEGAGRLYKKEYKRFILISIGSCSELIYYILLSRDLKYISENQFNKLDNKARIVKKMLFGLVKKI